MKKLTVFLLTIGLMVMQSCIPTKKLIYLQDDNSKIENTPSENYRFKKGDLIYIDIKTRDEGLNALLQAGRNRGTNNVSGENLYFTAYMVDKDGMIELPVLGKMRAEGLTAPELKENIINKLLESQLRNRQDAFVKVMPAGIFVTVLGEVGGTGTVHIFKSHPNILEAIALSGDIKLTGNRTDVMVIRTKAGGEKEIAHLDLTKRSVMNSPYFYLKNNDIIYVKPLPQKTIGTGTTLIQTLTTIMSITSFAISLYLFSRR
ncbi:MAG: sugar transporter [Chlorobi bacterium]|nr:sugar transporter [Chlorobiota bacterium]